MALSLILRNANKMPSRYPCCSFFAGVPFKNSTSFSHSCFKVGKPTLLSNSKITNVIQLPVRKFGGSDFRTMWTIERMFTVAMLGIIPATVFLPSPILDNVCAIVVGLHMHWGLEAVCQDYVRPIVVGNLVPKLATGATYIFSILIIGGLLYFNYTDVGIGKGIRKLWAIKE